MFKEFKKFIMRGNMLDMAVAVIIGGAFSAIINSLVNNILMPLIGLALGGSADFSNAFIVLKEPATIPDGGLPETLAEAQEAGYTCLGYGAFISAIIMFLIVALCLFLVIKAFNKAASLRKKEEEVEAAPTTKVCPFCKTEINIEATRCPHCTSELPAEEAAE
ncbi:MAG: large conductance mechanosensitive channel protein MscL [Lachnospiraceae bacterium]|nr:large conductance mechanosensitive channel protein MscL [Lachnospiraceae bacterium]